MVRENRSIYGGMVEWVDTPDFKGGYKIHKFECTRGNSGCRTSLNGEDLTGSADVNAVPMLLIASEYAFHKTLKPVTIIDSA